MDCSGNSLQTDLYYRFGLACLPRNGDVLISEILFNPLPGCSDYIELYNNSGDIFDLSDLRLSLRDAATRQLEGNWPVADRPRLLYPAEYVVLSENPDALADYYYLRDPSACIRSPGFPPLGDREGYLVLMNRQGGLVDELHYREEMHFTLLDSREGISLERVSFTRTASDDDNWHSASATAGFGTPGYENSQSLPAAEMNDHIIISPRFFSPDNDGRQDILCIRYSFDRPGTIIKVLVFDPRGRLVCRLADNRLAGTGGIITWNGTDDSGVLARTGMYLVLIEYYDLQGRKTRIRECCILG
jgi:hypothetical protein